MGDESVLERILNGEEDPKDLTLTLLQSITNDFSQDRKIGQGGFGVVYKGVLRNGAVVAVKRIHINEDTVDDKLFRREFNSLWKANNHQNVVRFLGFCSNSYHTTIVKPGSEEIKLANVRERLLCFEYISNGSLDKHITDTILLHLMQLFSSLFLCFNALTSAEFSSHHHQLDELRGLEWETRYGIIIGICNGLCHLKEKNIIHMDLKPANILLDDHMLPKITDFGLSRPNESSHTIGRRFGTRGYLAPEYENAGKTLVKSDIYSLGAIITELVTGCMGAPDKINVLRRWRHRWSKPPTVLQYQQVTRCIDIAACCRQQEPGHRPSISEIISSLIGPESTDVHTGQVSPCFDEDDMLGIMPLELRLPSELKEEISCFTVELTNDTRSCIAFNIQLPSRQQYNAQPDIGIVQPQSKYGVKITVQARDAHEHDHADKFIVQSMKLSDGLKHKVITKSMFHEEAGKVVDEVNLMVVYVPTKPQENCKSREDTNMPEEVPEVKKSKIVESASGKGKLFNTESPHQNAPVENVPSSESIPAREPPQHVFFPSSGFSSPSMKTSYTTNPAINIFFHPKCDVCKNLIPTNKNGLIEYRAQSFWMQKYCPSHEDDGTPRCCSCERMEPRDIKYITIDDGRKLCLECLTSATMDSPECQHLYIDIQEFFDGLNMKVEQQVPLLLVERQALNEALEAEKSGHHLPKTRGLCLSEEQTVRTILRRPTIGPGNRIIDVITGPYKLVRRCEVTAILILYGLPRLQTGSILAHEMMHAYLRLKGYRSLSPQVEEGICQVLSHMWLESEIITGASGSAASKKGAKTEFEIKLGAFIKNQIKTDSSVEHGDGFRAGNRAVERYALRSTLDHMKLTGSFPY